MEQKRKRGSRIAPPAFSVEECRKQNYIGNSLAAARRRAGMSRTELCRALDAYGLDVQEKAISTWELGTRMPTVYHFLALCHALDLDDLASVYQPALNDVGLKKLSEYKADLIASGRYAPDTGAEIKYIEMPVSYLAASAGTGMFLDDDGFEIVSVPADIVPAGAERGIRVSGDSMEPAYHDGQIVWIEFCETLRSGEVGVFVCDGNGYLKVYGEQEPEDAAPYTDGDGVVHKQPVLISYNPKYAPRVVSPYEDFRIFGRVLR